MKKYQKSSLTTMFFFIFLGCSNDASNTATVEEECIDEIVMPTQIAYEGDTVNITTAPKIDDAKTLEGIKVRAESSKVKDDECCISPDNIKPCCCEEVVKRYESLLKKNDFKGASELKVKDPFYKACKDSQSDFEDKIKAVDTAILGE